MRQYAIQSDHDALTALLNRRGFAVAITRHLNGKRSAGVAEYLIVLMVDLDNFKRLNDTHGHRIGDITLQRVAGMLTQQAPKGAAVCRAGGEEFLMAFTYPTGEVSTFTNDLCAAIRHASQGMTASIGVASAEPQEIISIHAQSLIERLITAADAAMYEAKRNGGNRVHVTQDSTPPTRRCS